MWMYVCTNTRIYVHVRCSLRWPVIRERERRNIRETGNLRRAGRGLKEKERERKREMLLDTKLENRGKVVSSPF